MSSLMEKVGSFFSRLKDYAGDFWERLGDLPQLLQDDPQAFLMVAGALVLAVLLIVALIAFLASRKRSRAHRKPGQRRRSAPPPSSAKVFIPVEPMEAEVDTVFLPLDERIVACRSQLSDDVLERIKKLGPRALADVVSAFKRCQPAIQAQLTAVVREQRLLEAYARRLLDEDYPQGLLVDAWYCFPSDAVLKGFVELLASRDQRMQMAAVRLLSALKEPKSLSMLMLALVQPERYLPARVAEVFVSMPQQSAALLTYMLLEVDDKHKEAVLEIIAATETTFEPANVLACLRHKNYRIRAAAAKALGSGRIQEALPQLLLAANDKRWQVRAAAAKSLGQLGDNRSVAILEALTQDSEGWVADNARAALDIFHNA